MEKFEQEFDQYIKSIVDQSEPLVDPQWDHMKHQLELAEEDANFDSKINSILSQAKADGPQLSWDQFNSKTLAQTERKYKIIKARAIESILLLLIIWTLNNIGITHLLPEKVKDLNLPILAESGNNYSSEKPEDNSSFSAQSSMVIEDKETGKVPSYSSQPETIDRIEKNNFATSSSTYSIQKNARIPSAGKQSSSQSTNGTLSQIASVVSERKEIGISAFAHPSEFSQIVNSGFENISAVDQQLAFTPLLILNNAGVNQSINTKSDIQLPVINAAHQIKTFNPESRTFVGLNTGLMVNSVESPAFVIGNPNLSQVKLGQQFGLSLNFQSNKWIVETGITYQNLSYNPNISETMGNFEEGYYKILFRKINSQLVNIPILLHRVLASGHDWQLSTKMGLSISAALKNSFTVDTFANLNGSGRGFAIPPNSESQIAQRIADRSNQGLLDGGSFGTNSFANVVLGLRWQKQISRSIDFVSELELHKMLGQLGYGPNGDKLLTTTIKTGISINLP